MGKGHKGGRRQFTDPLELEHQKAKQEKERQWRKKRGEVESSDEEAESSSEEESSEEEKPRGASNLIEVNNPNRIVRKIHKKQIDSLVDGCAKVELSRREREELEKQQAREHYQKLTAEGKTEQAQADLARLAIIRKQREEAARRKEAEKKAKEETQNKAAMDKTASTKSSVMDVMDKSASTSTRKKGSKTKKVNA